MNLFMFFCTLLIISVVLGITAFVPSTMLRKTMISLFFISITMVSIGLYSRWGNFKGLKASYGMEAIQKTLVSLNSEPVLTESIVESKLSALASGLPEDPLVWMRLGEVYQTLQWHEKAVLAYEKALQLDPHLDTAKIKWSYAKSMLQGGVLDKETYKAVKDILQRHPNESAAINLLATDLYQRGEFREAIRLWEGTLTQTNDQRERAAVQKAIERAIDKWASLPQSEGVKVQVRLAEHVKQELNENMPVFVFAKLANTQNQAPLAVTQRRVGDLPCVVYLDKGHAMLEGHSLALDKPIVVGARVSKSGRATPAVGDLQGLTLPFKMSKQKAQVTVDQ